MGCNNIEQIHVPYKNAFLVVEVIIQLGTLYSHYSLNSKRTRCTCAL